MEMEENKEFLPEQDDLQAVEGGVDPSKAPEEGLPMEFDDSQEPAAEQNDENQAETSMDIDKSLDNEEKLPTEKKSEVTPEETNESEPESNVMEPESEPEIKKEIDEEPPVVRSEGFAHIEMNNENIAETNDVKPAIHPKQEMMENALSALASAAMDHMKESESGPTVGPPEPSKWGPAVGPPEPPKDPKEIWHTVGFIKSTSFNVQNYFYMDEPKLDFTDDKEPDITNFTKIPLEPGTAYKFRVAAVNSVGRSDWSDVSAFKTCVPGFPSAPSAIKIAKSADGAHISWEPPKGQITEYSVYLAVKNAKENLATASMAFVRVYAGPSNSCVVPHSSLATAHVDTTTKSAIIFRIAARNEKGYGPATQVRWLQESMNKPVKRPTEDAQANLKKTKTD